jgi:hypothetical protein
MSNVVTVHKHYWEMELARREIERELSPNDMAELARGRAIVAGLKALLAEHDGIGLGLTKEQRAWLEDTINTDLQRAAFLSA